MNGVKEKSKLIFDTLEGAKGVESVTGMGLMIGIKTTKPAADVVRELHGKGRALPHRKGQSESASRA